ncbi:MAG: DNA adenine methylase [Clostridiaceae bacterium]|nr:DNA adenine methylase [Clostridiaceae bacterium]
MAASKKNRLVQPVVKWAGGKRQLLQEIDKYIPKKISTYYEPFLGGGALLFHLQPRKAIVSDMNEELINIYNVIRDNVEELIFDLQQHANTEEHYYYIREMDRLPEYERMTNIQKASRIIYLNKTCYNGLFRVNSQGQFNVPFGKYKKPNIVNDIVLRAVSGFLNSKDIRFLNVDYEESLNGIRRGAFVYFDPPYDPVSDTSSFTGYTLDGFGRDEQLRLKQVCDRLNQRGIKFLLSNSATPFIKELYEDYIIEIVGANRSINSNASNRGEIREVLVRNYDVD